MNGIENVLLRISGMPQSTIDEIEKATPAAAALIKLAQDNDTLIHEIVDLAAKAQPLLAQVAPLVNQAIIEIEALLPAARDLLAFLNAPPAPVPTADDIRNQQGAGPT